MKKNWISVSPSFFFPLAFLFWKSPPREIFLFLLSIFLHEGSHLLTISLLGEKAENISLSVTGASIRLSSRYVSYRKEILLYLAGPLGNLLGMALSLFLLRIEFTKEGMFFFFCNALLAIFNLLPVRGLDGERALFAFLCLLIDMEKAQFFCLLISRCTLLVLFLFSLHLFLREENPSLIFLVLSLLAESGQRKALFHKKSERAPVS